jgi:hypothetical protein
VPPATDGVRVHSAGRPFTIGSRKYDVGTAIVRVGENASDLATPLGEIAARWEAVGLLATKAESRDGQTSFGSAGKDDKKPDVDKKAVGDQKTEGATKGAGVRQWIVVHQRRRTGAGTVRTGYRLQVTGTASDAFPVT